jgi:2-polyprenyl-6-methoxyphenol hydroxylase-like FAD-dependent oxidoreductase
MEAPPFEFFDLAGSAPMTMIAGKSHSSNFAIQALPGGDKHANTILTQLAIVGGGPAGMMLGLLMARAGLDVVVLEKHADFLRDFRGDTVHPSTLEVIYELGLLEEFLKRPHQKLQEISGVIGGEPVKVADFRHVPAHCRFIALMPQWHFLDFLAEHAKRYTNFHLVMEAGVTDLIEDNGKVTGVVAETPQGRLQVRANLVVGCDGRHSVVRKRAGLPVVEFGAPIDVLWMKLSKAKDDSPTTLGRMGAGAIFVTLDRGDYWQCALVIAKGGAEALRQQGLEAFRERILRVAPSFAGRVGEIQSWDQVKLLTVTVNRLKQWYRMGLLCIGDAAHAMSPIGGIGINLALQDAVATANLLAPAFAKGGPSIDDLRRVQRRRELPTKLTQTLQMFIQDQVMTRVLALKRQPRLPLPVRLLNRFAWLRRIPARLIGIGFRPEHVQSPIGVNASQIA